MKMKNIVLGLTALSLVATTPAVAQLKAPQVSSEGGISTSTASASDAFPGLKGFLSLPAAERSQINVYYVARIKRADKSQVKITLIDGGRQIPLTIQGDGRITPLPSLAQLNGGAKITISGPQSGSYSMKIKVNSTQGNSRTYDAAGLTLGVKQGNAAVGKIAGAASFLVKKLDRIYFVGGGSGTVEVGGQQKALPRTAAAGEYPAGTPYFVPSQFAGATRITLANAASNALFDTAPK
jgi:hypothetical protein